MREAYQFTHIDSATYSVDKYRHDDGQTNWTDKNYTKIAGSEYYIRTDESGKSAQEKRQLRSRIGLDYDIPHWKFDPFVSYELFNDIDNGFKTEKSRLTAGVEFSFKKMHNFEVAYMWQNQHDDDEPAGSFVCLSYKFDF